jgi:hypothetical protein
MGIEREFRRDHADRIWTVEMIKAAYQPAAPGTVWRRHQDGEWVERSVVQQAA